MEEQTVLTVPQGLDTSSVKRQHLGQSHEWKGTSWVEVLEKHILDRAAREKRGGMRFRQKACTPQAVEGPDGRDKD